MGLGLEFSKSNPLSCLFSENIYGYAPMEQLRGIIDAIKMIVDGAIADELIRNIPLAFHRNGLLST